MLYSSICKNFRWKMQEMHCKADVFVMELEACDMVHGVQWLATLGDIVCNYKNMWMSFEWQGQLTTLRGEELVKLQSIQFGQMSGLLSNRTSIAGINLCGLMMIQDTFDTATSTTAKNLNKEEKAALKQLLHLYQDVFIPMAGLPPSRPHDHTIPLKEGA